MATLILTAVGTAVGGPIGGAIGALLGRGLDQAVLFKPGRREGPRLAELQVQTSSYGTPVPQLFGTMRVAGTVIWATDLRETVHKSGGGKGQPSVRTYSYSVSFAVALSSARAVSVGRIWADGNLLRGEAGDFKSALGAFRFHDGGEGQVADPLIAAAEGIGVTPAHRGMAYAVFEDLALEDFGNRIPSLTFELVGADMDGMVASLSGGAVAGAAGVMGYAAEGASARDALTPLAEAQGWVLREGEGGLVLDRGVDGEVIPRGALAARVNGRVLVPVRRARARAEDVPARLSLRHYEPERDYQAGVQKGVRSGPGRREATSDVPAVVEANAAKALAQARLADGWAGRESVELRCGWEALLCAPGSVVGVEGLAGRWRVEESEWEAMAVRLALRRLPGGSAAPVEASAGSGVRQPDAPHGATTLMLVELPAMDEGLPAAPVVVAAAAGASTGWRRAALFTVEPGSEAAVPAGSTAPAAVMGSVAVPPGDGTAMLFDERATIEVTLLSVAMLLEDASDEALLRGANACLIGREVVQFGRAEQTGPAAWRLRRLLRGRRGTEWAMAGHEAGEPFLLIEAERLAAVPAGAVHLGETVAMLAIGIGDAEPAEASIGVTGEAMMPPNPVHLRVERLEDGAAVVRWMRRSRAGWAWRDGVDAPLGEESERYRVALFDGNLAVRSVEVSGPSWTYDAAMQAADAGAGHGLPLRVEVRQVGTLAVGRAGSAMLG